MTNTGRPDQEHVLDRLEAICQTMMRAPADAGASRDVAFIADAAGRVQFITRAAAEALEAGGQERAGGPVEDLLEPGSWDLERLGLSQIVRSGLPMSFEGKATLADRETVLNTTLEPLGGAGGEARAALGIAREVTRRRGADAAAATAGEGLSRVFRDAPVPMLVVDSERVVRQLNGAAVRFVHRRRRDVVGRRIGDAVRCLHALGSPAGCGSGLLCKTCPIHTALRSTLRAGRSHHRVEASLPTRRRGHEGDSHFLVTTVPLHARGERRALLCLEDISERRHTERALEESQRARATLMRNLPGMAYRCRNDEHWTMEFVSEGCLDLTGYRASGLLLNHVTSFQRLIHPDDRAPVRRAVAKAVRRRAPFELTYRITTADGQLKWVWEKGMGVYGPRGRIVALEGFITDITARRRAEEEKENMQALLLQAQKMEAIAVLAGGVAHDFNNLLTIVQGNAELAMLADEEGAARADLLGRILSAAEHGAGLVRQLLVFSRKHPMQMAPLDINHVVRDLLRMLGRLIGEDIVIETQLADDLATARADQTGIEQIIMNLAVNARDAMPDGGRLVITTDTCTLGPDDCAAMPEARPGRFVRLAVADTGIGMDGEIVQRIFEPFFSTKEPGHGTGLGLSVVYGIVQQHEGWIDVASEPGRGSTFRIHLPASERRPEGVPHGTPRLEELRGHGERLLLVEDEAEVRDFARRALTHSGYHVVVAADAEQAQAIFDAGHGAFDLVVSDVVLPGKSGVLLADALRSTQPQLRVLLTSGYVDRKSQWRVIRDRGFPFLQKPYSLFRLLHAIQRVLAAER